MSGRAKQKAKDFDFEVSGAKNWRAFAGREVAATSSPSSSKPIEGAQPEISQTPPAPSFPSDSSVLSHYFDTLSQQPPTSSIDPPPTADAPNTFQPPATELEVHLEGPYAYPDIGEMNRRRDHDFAPEGFTFNNEAHQRARDRLPPDDQYNFSMFFPDGFKGKFYGPRDINLAHIAAKTNTYIATSSQDIHIVELWGPPDGIEEAKADLYKLGQFALQNSRLSVKNNKKKEKFAKVKAAPTEVQAERIAKHWNIENKRLHYKQKPEDPGAFPVVGVFNWPEKDINPQTALGINTEGLDELRYDHEVHIDYDRKTSSLLVYGMKHVNVQGALDRIHGVLCEVATKNRWLGTTAVRIHMVIPPTSDQFLKEVYLDTNHNLLNRQITVKRLPENNGVQCHLYGKKPPQRILANWDKKRATLLKANSLFFRNVVQRGLDDTLYCRTHVVMKVNFGTLVLFGYQRPSGNSNSHDTLAFMEMMRNKSVQAELVKHIGPASVANELISICRSRSVIFVPKHIIVPLVRDFPEMLYTATFALTLSDNNCSTDIRLECDFGQEIVVRNRRHFKVTNWNWLSTPKHGHQYRNKHDNEGAYKRKGPLDVKVLNLAESLAWQLEISSYSRVRDSELYPIFNDFIRNITLDVLIPEAGVREEDCIPLISWTNLSGLEVDSVVVKCKHQWYLSVTPYIFEVTKYEFYATTRHTPEGVSANNKGMTADTRWGAGLTSRDWIDRLSTQWSLSMGCRGSWRPSITAFFQPSNIGGINDPLVDGRPKERAEWMKDGFAEFEGRVTECMELIVKAKRSAKKRAELAKKGVHEDDMD